MLMSNLLRWICSASWGSRCNFERGMLFLLLLNDGFHLFILFWFGLVLLVQAGPWDVVIGRIHYSTLSIHPCIHGLFLLCRSPSYMHSSPEKGGSQVWIWFITWFPLGIHGRGLNSLSKNICLFKFRTTIFSAPQLKTLTNKSPVCVYFCLTY